MTIGQCERLEKRCLLTVGGLDPFFGSEGTTQLSITGGATDVKVAADGKIMVAGGGGLVRLDAEGNLDPGFGIGGLVTVPNFSGQVLLIMPDGKIVLGGTSANTGLGVCRLFPNGVVDTSFGINGFGTTPDLSDRSAKAFSMTLDHTGRFLVMGNDETSQKSQGVVARFNANGTLDTSFAGRGYVAQDFSGTGGIGSIWYDGVVLANDQILLSGTAYKGDGTPTQLCLTRFNINGGFDATFATGGTRFLGQGGWETCLAAAPDGGYYLGAGIYQGFTLQKLTASGVPDPLYPTSSFGVADYGVYAAMEVQSNGQIIASTGYDRYAIGRFNSDLSVDRSYGSSGVLQVSARGGNALALQPDNSAIVLGRTGSFDSYVVSRRDPVDYFDAFAIRDGVLHLHGDANANQIQLDGPATSLSVTMDGHSRTFSDAGITSVELMALSGADRIELGADVPGGLIIAGSGADQITLSNGDSQERVLQLGADNDSVTYALPATSQVALDGGDSLDTITINGTDEPETVAIGPGNISIGAASLQVDNLETAYINTLGGSDEAIINSSGTYPKIQFDAGDGDDHFQVNDKLNTSGALKGGSGINSMTLDLAAAPSSFAVYATQLSASFFTLSVSQIQNVDVALSEYADVLTIYAIPSAQFTVDMLGGDDRVELLTLAALTTQPNINFNSGKDTLGFTDSSAAALTLQYDLTASYLQRGAVNVAFSGAEVLRGQLGSAQSTVSVHDLGGLQSVSLTGGNGNEDIHVALAGAISPAFTMTIAGGGGSDTLTVDRSQDLLAHTYRFLNKDFYLDTQLLASVTTVENINLLAGGGDDHFEILPHTGAVFALDGGAGIDSLEVLTGGTDPVFHSTGAASGYFDMLPLAQLRFENVESSSAHYPVMQSAAINVEQTPFAITVVFDHPVSGIIPLSSVHLLRASDGSEIASSNLISVTPPAANAVQYRVLPNAGLQSGGNFQLVFDNACAGDGSRPARFEFFFLNADATRDRVVDTRDFNILAGQFGASNAGFSTGDFNFDRKVNSLDFNVFVSNYGARLPSPGAFAALDDSDDRFALD